MIEEKRMDLNEEVDPGFDGSMNYRKTSESWEQPYKKLSSILDKLLTNQRPTRFQIGIMDSMIFWMIVRLQSSKIIHSIFYTLISVYLNQYSPYSGQVSDLQARIHLI